MIITLPRDELIELLDGSSEKFKLITDTIIGHSRWSVEHELIFQYNNKFYKTHYQRGATEMQDERPWEYQDDIECQEVKPMEKTIVIYEEVGE